MDPGWVLQIQTSGSHLIMGAGSTLRISWDSLASLDPSPRHSGSDEGPPRKPYLPRLRRWESGERKKDRQKRTWVEWDRNRGRAGPEGSTVRGRLSVVVTVSQTLGEPRVTVTGVESLGRKTPAPRTSVGPPPEVDGSLRDSRVRMVGSPPVTHGLLGSGPTFETSRPRPLLDPELPVSETSTPPFTPSFSYPSTRFRLHLSPSLRFYLKTFSTGSKSPGLIPPDRVLEPGR